MADKVITTFAQERALPLNQDTAMFRSGEGYLFSYGYYPALSNWGLSVNVDETTYDKEKHKELKQALKPCKAGLGAFNQKGLIQVTAGGVSKDARAKSIDAATQVLRAELPRLGLLPKQTCHICGQPGSDDCYIHEKVGYPVHGSCKVEKAASILAEVERNQQSGNLFLGLVGALLGGIVGSLPSALVIHFMDAVSGVLFMLIPMAAYFGYKTFKGVLNLAVPFIISIISLLSTIIMMLGYCYTIFAVEYGDMITMSGESPVSVYFQIITDPAMRGDLIEIMAMPLLFCVIGIAFAWSYISRTNKHMVREAQEIMQSGSRQ